MYKEFQKGSFVKEHNMIQGDNLNSMFQTLYNVDEVSLQVYTNHQPLLVASMLVKLKCFYDQ